MNEALRFNLALVEAIQASSAFPQLQVSNFGFNIISILSVNPHLIVLSKVLSLKDKCPEV